MKEIKLIILFSLLFILNMYAITGKDIIRNNGYMPYVKPMLSTHWSQDGGENSKLPFIDSENTIHAFTGCGATALAQIMNYWKYPLHGNGFNYYPWHSPFGPDQILYADFENTLYDWEQTIPFYKGNDFATNEQIDAVSTLMAHIGVALEMNYDIDGTGTQIEYICTVLRKFFGYNPNMCIIRQINEAYSMEEWLNLIYKELSEGRPILMGGSKYSDSLGSYVNHIFVADGYDEEGWVHLNLGKADIGSNKDTYYDLSQEGNTYTKNMRMIIGICPNPLPTEINEVYVEVPGSLLEKLGGVPNSRKICRLKITGQINKKDLNLLKEMAATTTGQLTYLDLSQCILEGGIIEPNSFYECYTLQEIYLPNNVTEIREGAFYSCRGLYKVRLPDNLEFLERYAFDDCRYLDDISLPITFNRIDNNPFGRSKLCKFEIDEGNKKFKIVNGSLLSKDGKTLYAMPLRVKGRYSVPNGVERIMGKAFQERYMMDTLNLPASLIKISESFGELGGKVINLYAENPPERYFFDLGNQNCVLHVPIGCANKYIDQGWEPLFSTIIDDLPINSTIEETTHIKQNGSKYFNLLGRQISESKSNDHLIIKMQNGRTKKYMMRKRRNKAISYF